MVTIRPVHTRVPGRIRYDVPALRRNRELAERLERVLPGAAGVLGVRASPRTGTLLILFAPERSRSAWETTLAQALGTSPREHSEPPLGQARPAWQRRGERRDAEASAASEQRAQEPVPDTQPAWHAMPLEDVCRQLALELPQGLSTQSAAARLESDGPNVLAPAPCRGRLRIFAEQFASVPVAMLGGSAALSVVTGGLGEALAILAVVGINAGVGYTTENRAERTIEALTRMPQGMVPVQRDGQLVEVALNEVVGGDLLVLRAGVFVAADARIIDAEDLTVDESSLTGESVPVAKAAAERVDAEVPLAERKNMVFRGTQVTGGSGHALAVATAEHTQLGKIQALLGSVEQRGTPMQEQLDHLGRQLALGAGLACAATMGVGVLRGQPLLSMLRAAVSLGVAAVPEGLPTVAVSTLALGLARMREERVIVRKLAAVETLGSVQVACLDKTGTLTQNRMTAVAIEAGLGPFDVHDGRFMDAEQGAPEPQDLEWLMRLCVLCNEVELTEVDGVRVLKGSATESALLQLALDAGVEVSAWRERFPLIDVQRRAQARNYMRTTHQGPRAKLVAVKGRPSEVLALCSSYLRGGKRLPLSEQERAQVENNNECMAGRALRVLGFAFQEQAEADASDGTSLVWAGLIGMEDPPREQVRDVIASLHAAGVRTVMITGDQSATAQAIGRKVGLASNGNLEIMDSTRLDVLDARVLSSLAQRVDVFSRVSPAHKLQIVKALQSAGQVVAMTGDGVNDGPALKAADIGIAMGASGTSAAREVADLVLEDDDLQTLMLAIKQGRTIYDDIRKAVRFILATNSAEILYTFTCVASGLGEPLSPLQLLWINLLTDVFPELALATQPAESDVLARGPRDPSRPMLTSGDLLELGRQGTVITAGGLAAYLIKRRSGAVRANSVGFTALTLALLLHTVSARSEAHSIFDRGRLAYNRWLPLAVGGPAALQLAATLVPGLRTLLGTVPLRLGEWGLSLGAAVSPFLINESIKFLTVPKQVREIGSLRASSATDAEAAE